jgi:hypothetical protein
MMSIGRSDVMAISAERSDARLFQCETVIAIPRNPQNPATFQGRDLSSTRSIVELSIIGQNLPSSTSVEKPLPDEPGPYPPRYAICAEEFVRRNRVSFALHGGDDEIANTSSHRSVGRLYQLLRFYALRDTDY